MTVSLLQLLRSSQLDRLRSGIRQDEVLALLGEPDATGGTSRKYPTPAIYVYGTLEFHFSQRWPKALVGVYWEPGNTGELRVPEGWKVENWDFRAGMCQTAVVDYLIVHGLSHEMLSPSEALISESGVRITFEGQALYALYAPQCDHTLR